MLLKSGYNEFTPLFTFSPFSANNYNSTLTLVFSSELYRLADKYDYVTVEVYGRTHEGRELLALHINKQDKDEVVFLNSLIHAREWVVGCVTMNIIHRVGDKFYFITSF